MNCSRLGLLFCGAGLLAPSGGCKDADNEQPSSLAQRAERAAAEPSVQPPTHSDGREPAKGSGPTAELVGAAPPPEAERIQLALALPEATYVVHTIGNVQLPLVGLPVGFAREERIRLDGCQGEGPQRQCMLHHRSTEFEAEGKGGEVLANDERKVASLETHHLLSATGMRRGNTRVDGPDEALATEVARGLVDVHRFFCIRFPDEPVGVGAKWRDSCKRHEGGRIVTRSVLWELSSIDDDPDGAGKRAELRYVGTYSRPAADGSTESGTVEGILYFRAGRGEPHTLKEQITVALDPRKGAKTVTLLSYTFGRVVSDGKGNERLVLTDGQPFPRGINAGEGPGARPQPAGG